ncbi:MAG: hypothetical protein N2170_01895 [Bacteroidia bacterium]|nr:hypothetical protein [Bacteroidia bacterium]
MRWVEVEEAWKGFLDCLIRYEEHLQGEQQEAAQEGDLSRLLALRKEQKRLHRIRFAASKITSLLMKS